MHNHLYYKNKSPDDLPALAEPMVRLQSCMCTSLAPLTFDGGIAERAGSLRVLSLPVLQACAFDKP